MGKSVARGGSSEAKPQEKPSPVSSHKDEAFVDAVIQKRAPLPESIEVQQKAERLKLDAEPIRYVFFPFSLRFFMNHQSDYLQRVDLIQDLKFETATTKIKVTPDGDYVIASGMNS
ncbi:hypothetical protein BHE74_00045970 [Ensete ventricosum]|nr:hypothetical protein BHE74_00045970 [Ensete ventricosum]